MIRAAILCILLLVATAATSTAQSVNGNTWIGLADLDRETEQVAKSSLVSGMIQGVINLAPLLVAADPQAAFFAKEYQAASQGWLHGITVKQVVAGVDVLYSDFRNRSLPVYVAVSVVLRQIHGDTPAVIEALLQELRKAAASVPVKP